MVPLDSVFRKEVSQKMAFALRPDGHQRAYQPKGKYVSGRGNSRCQAPGVSIDDCSLVFL